MFFNDCCSPLLEILRLHSGRKAITDFSKAASEKMDHSKSKTNTSLARSVTAFPVKRYVTL